MISSPTQCALVDEGRPSRRVMAKRGRQVTCDDCYFRRQGLCALPGNAVCPTYRAATTGELAPPQQPPLVARPLSRVAVAQAAAA